MTNLLPLQWPIHHRPASPLQQTGALIFSPQPGSAAELSGGTGEWDSEMKEAAAAAAAASTATFFYGDELLAERDEILGIFPRAAALEISYRLINPACPPRRPPAHFFPIALIHGWKTLLAIFHHEHIQAQPGAASHYAIRYSPATFLLMKEISYC